MSAPPLAHAGALADDLRGRVFAVGADPSPPRVGLEVELLPTDRESGRPLPLRGDGARSSVELLRELAREKGWRERRTTASGVHFEVSGGGRLTFEPGGQIEFSSAPRDSVDALLGETGRAVGAVKRRFRCEGVDLVSRGVDPRNDVDAARLQVRTRRYRRLAAHLGRIGPAGRRMMLQTAAVHVNVDFGPEPLRRWRAANALVPALIAVFANSARYAAEETGFRSFRARQWRELDPSRTGVFDGVRPIAEYLRFALDAGAILMGEEGETPRPFREWLAGGEVAAREWRAHLDTLFPEVRPRGYLEVRCLDALPPRWYAAPVVFVVGILCDPEACRTALEVLEPAGEEELEAAARTGLTDPERAERCLRLFDLALDGARRLELVGQGSLERARAFRNRYTGRGEDPAGDPDAGRA